MILQTQGLSSKILLLFFALLGAINGAKKPHIILVMADDQGWAQMGYMDHRHFKENHLRPSADRRSFEAGSAQEEMISSPL